MLINKNDVPLVPPLSKLLNCGNKTEQNLMMCDNNSLLPYNNFIAKSDQHKIKYFIIILKLNLD